jgi:dihydroflavonol-4-reductase
MSKQTVLLTGATGLIGRHVAAKLASLPDLHLVCIVREGDRHPEAASLVKQGAKVLAGNFYDAGTIKAAFERYSFDYVIHLAAIRGGGEASPAEFQEVNVRGTERLLCAAYEHRVREFIFCSSVGVHGTIPVAVPAAIETALHGDNQYHRSKIASEEAVQAYIRKGLNAYIVRPTITYGPGDNGFPQTLVHLVKGHLLWLPMSNHQVHLVDVDRVAEVFLNLLVNGDASQRIFVVGDMSPISLKDLADWIHWHLYKRPYPAFLRLPDWAFKAAFNLFTLIGNEKWATRMALLSNDWHYQCADTYRLLGIEPIPTREAFGRFLRETAVAPR